MQINDGNLLGIHQPATGQAERAGQASAARTAGAGGAGPQDAVQLSSFASKINDLRDESPARQARVEELRSLYATGRYEVDPATLAQSLVDSHIRS
jgi:flagellar biosynthesis anti-sigma factor FlgM